MTNKEVIEELMYLKHMVREDSNADKALDMAIEALKQTQWIPCSERLPEVGEDVFISVGRDVWEAHLRASKEYFLIHSGRMLVKTEETDAWMPLPKAYEGRKE